MTDSAAWLIDGSYLSKAWQSLDHEDRLDFLKLCSGVDRAVDQTSRWPGVP